MTQEDRKLARAQEGDQAMVEVSPGGTDGGGRPTRSPPWGGSSEAIRRFVD